MITSCMTTMPKPVIILIETQMARNIGTTARAMLNFGLTRLRLVRPLADPLSKDARALAAGADEVLEQAEIFEKQKMPCLIFIIFMLLQLALVTW